jgi:hypothetical protein
MSAVRGGDDSGYYRRHGNRIAIIICIAD